MVQSRKVSCTLASLANLPIIHERRALALLLALALAPAWAQKETAEQKAERARAALAEERYDEAATLYQELVRSDPDNTGLRANLGLVQHARGQWAKAAEQLEIVIKQEPKFAGAWRLLGDCRGKLGQKERAVAALFRATELEPRDSGTRLDYASALRAVNRNEDANAEFWRVAQADPQEPRAWHGLVLTNVALARVAKSESKRKECWTRAGFAFDQLKETATGREDLLDEAAKAMKAAPQEKP